VVQELTCSHTVEFIADEIGRIDYICKGSTVNLCALDISTVFDKMSHHGLFIEIMNRLMPITLLFVLEEWFNCFCTFVKWLGLVSLSFKLLSEVCRGGVLSPYLFAVYIDDLIIDIVRQYGGCTFHFVSVCIVVYAMILYC